MGTMDIGSYMSLNPTVLSVVLAFAVLVMGAFSAAFVYHWKEYGLEGRLIRIAPAVYLTVSLILCAFALISYIALL